MTWLAKVIEHSRVPSTGAELITFQLRYPRFIHAEAKTHRMLTNSGIEYVALTQDAGFMSDPMLSRNASSSRAIPVEKMIAQVRNDPAMPVHWGANQKGMQARAEVEDMERAKALWLRAARDAADTAEVMMDMGLHKQVANRILEPFQFINVIVSFTEGDNFYALRDHQDADPNIQKLARMMLEAQDRSIPRLLTTDSSTVDGWHLPWMTHGERAEHYYDPSYLARLSTARNARVSYLTHDGQNPDAAKDLGLFTMLVGATPLHASPTEHPAYALPDGATWCKNFRGFHQFRADIEAQFATTH